MVLCVTSPAPADTVMNHVVHHHVTKALDSVMMGVHQDGWDPTVHRVRSVHNTAYISRYTVLRIPGKVLH